MPTMLLNVRLFAGLREAAGADSVEVEAGEFPTAASLLETMQDGSELGDLLGRMPVRVAVNSAYVAGETRLSSGDEIALVPPISGGSQIRASVTTEPLDISAMSREVVDPAAGAVVSFQGVTREVDHLEYEAHESMAIGYSGPDLQVAFNPSFVMDPLKALTKDEVFFEVKDEVSPGVFKTLESFVCVIMPVRLS